MLIISFEMIAALLVGAAVYLTLKRVKKWFEKL